MRIATQLAIFLENRPGTLARVCEAMGEAGINIYAISTSDTVDHTVVRMVVSDPRRALFLLEERGTLVVEAEVLVIEVENTPGSLAALGQQLAANKINIEYLYSATNPNDLQGCMVLRVSNPAKALKALAAPRGNRRGKQRPANRR